MSEKKKVRKKVVKKVDRKGVMSKEEKEKIRKEIGVISKALLPYIVGVGKNKRIECAPEQYDMVNSLQIKLDLLIKIAEDNSID